MAVPGAPATGGLFESLRRLLTSTLGIARVRVELFGTELQAEKLRLFDTLWRAALGLLLIGVALVLAAAFVLLLIQEAYRLQALGVMVLVIAAAGVWCLLRARAGLRVPEGGPFALTLGELDRDLDGLEPSPGTARTPAPPPP